ncbi:MAG: pentapeptide repeat-containing protein [Alphaproteobacteria bacterium]|nr:pentapeptide repeat-containing protein [Alphaproteobacteria bacterium]
MFDNDKKKFNIGSMRDKVREARQGEENTDVEKFFRNNFSWQAISDVTAQSSHSSLKLSSLDEGFNFSGKVLRGGKYVGEKLQNANFSSADLKEVDFKNADLHGSDFTAADLSGADLSGANLNGAVFTGAKLRGTNFTGAKMNGVILVDADIQDAILLDVEMDQLALEELQALVEYLAIYYPHKLNLTRMNLTLLDFTKIDLSQVNLRGVDFTGVDFTGVNIFEWDLSECIITPEQIAQALGRPPTPQELKKILAPKNKKKFKLKGIDFTSFFDGRGTVGVWDLTKHPGISAKDLLKMSKQIYNAVIKKPEPKDEEIFAQFHKSNEEKQDALAKEHNDEVRKAIEERKRAVREEKVSHADEKPNKDYDLTDYNAIEQQIRREKEEYIKRKKEEIMKNKSKNVDMPTFAYQKGQNQRG